MQAAASITQDSSASVPAPVRRQSRFHELLSELNPLQYIPVIGTIYRAATGDTISDSARTVGSLVVSGLTSGPVGIAANLGMLAAEKVTGIDPEKIAQHLLADIGIGASPAAAAKPVPPAATPSTAPAVPAPASAAWSPAQLTAYGVTVAADGALARGSLHGSDVLNDLELNQLKSTALA